MASVQEVLESLNDMRNENREDHKEITTKLEKVTVSVAVLQSFRRSVLWTAGLLIPAGVGALLAWLL